MGTLEAGQDLHTPCLQVSIPVSGRTGGVDSGTSGAAMRTDVLLRKHSNDNLLKVDTHDQYSTAGALRKFIAKELADEVCTAPGQPLFEGMQRMNKNPSTPYLFMAFDTAANRDAASRLLQRLSYRGTPWREAAVTTRDLSLTHKGGVKRPRCELETCKLTQYERYPMVQQLELKRQHCLGVMRALLPERSHGSQAYATRFLGVVESPLQEGYRNHVTLSFGCDSTGKPTLGFQAGSLAEGSVTVESAVDADKSVLTMSAAAKVVAMAVMQVCETFLAKGLRVFNKVEGQGFWRKAQVRHNVLGQVMVDLELDQASVPADVFEEVRAELVAVLGGAAVQTRLQHVCDSASAGVVSLQYHAHAGIHSLAADAPRIVLLGGSTLVEYLAGMQFELSPTSFFQVNTGGTARLLERLREVAELRPTTTLLDLCCGTGTIALALAPHVRQAIGIELVASAVANARCNAQRNGVANAVFCVGRVEDTLPSVLRGLRPEEREDIVAILDPPRAGVHHAVLKWIRGTPSIRRVVYISCEQKALERDCPGLTKPSTKAYRGEPFEVSVAFAVDLFPHTPHVEMVVVLSRGTAAPGEATALAGGSEEAACMKVQR